MSTTRLPEFTPVPMTDEDRDAVFNALPDRLAGFMKLWGWLHFAKDIEAKAHEKNADQMHAYGLAVWKAAMDRAVAECEFAKPQNERSDWTEYAHGSARALDRAIIAIRSLPLPEQGGPQ